MKEKKIERDYKKKLLKKKKKYVLCSSIISPHCSTVLYCPYTFSHCHLRVYCHTFVSLVHSAPLLAKTVQCSQFNCRPRPSIVNQTPMILYRPVYTVTATPYSLAQFSFRNSDYVHRLQFQVTTSASGPEIK